MREAKTKNRGVRFLLVAACLVIVMAGLRAAGPILLPLLVAVMLSILSLPLLHWQQQHRFPRFVAVPLTVLANVAVVVAILLLVGGSLNAFSASLPRYQLRLQEKVEATLDWLEKQGVDASELRRPGPNAGSGQRSPERLPAEADIAPDGVVGAPDTTVDDSLIEPPEPINLIDVDTFVDLLGSTLRGVASLLTSILLVFFMMVFILFEAAGLPQKLQRALGWEGDDLARAAKATREIQRYLGLKTLISLATGTLLGLWVWLLDVDYAPLWGLIAFLLNYIPNLGSILAAIPAVLLALIEGGIPQALAVSVGYLVVNVSFGNFLEPHVMGRRLGLSTLVVFLSLVFWGWIWGSVGMLLSVPLTMILKITLENTEDFRWVAQLLGPNPLPLASGDPPTPVRSHG